MTPYDPSKHHRRSIRLPVYDYRSPRAYSVTICVRGAECLLGDIVDGQMHPSAPPNLFNRWPARRGND